MLGLAVLFVAILGLILWIRHGEFSKIDRCLDSGGAWNYAAKDCEH